MNYLLDTHSFLWSLFEPAQLSKPAKETIINTENTIWVSLVSYWEISIKFGLGKLRLENISPDHLPRLAKRAGFQTLLLNENEVSSFFRLPKANHSDPFDRMIIWQAICRNITIISKDDDFEPYQLRGLELMW